MPKKKAAPEAAPEATPEAAPEVVEEHRAPDQDGAIEVAFVEGTLPEEDRREPAIGAPEPPPSEDIPLLLTGLPVGYTVEYVRGEFGPKWIVKRGSDRGESKSLGRAIRLIGAQIAHLDGGGTCLLDQSGAIIPPEA